MMVTISSKDKGATGSIWWISFQLIVRIKTRPYFNIINSRYLLFKVMGLETIILINKIKTWIQLGLTTRILKGITTHDTSLTTIISWINTKVSNRCMMMSLIWPLTREPGSPQTPQDRCIPQEIIQAPQALRDNHLDTAAKTNSLSTRWRKRWTVLEVSKWFSRLAIMEMVKIHYNKACNCLIKT